MAQKSYKNMKYLQAFIVEDHHEVVPYIHSYIGSKQLPFEDLTMIHFDSHPDLLIPINMPADTVFNKHNLYNTLSIENWILPLVYAGHISAIYWLKPPWCEQIGETTLHFFVGKCIKTGTIRTTCKENYFISEALYASEDQLENLKKVSLTVICIKPQLWVNTDKNSSLTTEEEEIDAGKLSSTCSVQTRRQTDYAQNVECTAKQSLRDDVQIDMKDPQNVVHSKTNSPQDAVLSKTNFTENTENHKTNFPQDAVLSKTNCPKDAVISKTNFPQDAVLSKTNCPKDAVISKKNSTQDGVHIDRNCPQNSDSKFKENTALSTSPACDLENTIQNETKVKGEEINSHNIPEDGGNFPPQKKVKLDVIDNTNTLRKGCVLSPSVCEQLVKISEKLQGKRYILDIDLDFYSTRNPFKGLYSAEQLRLLSELYKYVKPDGYSSEAIQRCVEKREKQLSTLKDAISIMSTDINATVYNLDDQSRSLMKDLISNFDNSNTDIDFDLLHDAGCTMDDTELPHHVSSEWEIDQLMNATEEILKLLPQPTLVTAARSSNDDYCPAHQVEFIQQSVIQILDHAYPSLVVMPTYIQDLNDSS